MSRRPPCLINKSGGKYYGKKTQKRVSGHRESDRKITTTGNYQVIGTDVTETMPMVTINHTVTEAKIDGEKMIIVSDRTKTQSSYRSFPLSETLRETLLKWREIQKNNRRICGSAYNMTDIDYIFTDAIGNRFKPRYIEDTFPKLVEKAGLRHVRFHDLRHTCASLMHKMGMSPKEIQDYLGHSTISVTLNIYTHLDWSSKENAAKAMESMIKIPGNDIPGGKFEN